MHFTLAQRFAIDWEQIDAENRVVKGDTKTLSNYVIYGREVLAVADGTVVSSRNDLPEQVPGALPQGMTIDQADGNFVVLDIGGGSYVLYAHMQPGSVTVKAGAKVKRGDVLGKVGNTGNTQAPHLHLHVMDGPSPLQSNGIPYVFDSFKLDGHRQGGHRRFRQGRGDRLATHADAGVATPGPVAGPAARSHGGRVLAMKRRALAILMAGCWTLTGLPVMADTVAEKAIRDALTKWTADFNARDATRICDLFAPDLRYDFRDLRNATTMPCAARCIVRLATGRRR